MIKKKNGRRRRVRKVESESIVDTGTPGEFLNRDLSWLEFNKRVLAEAQDPRNPLLERVRFLTIFTSNLDEFFMKRVGSLKQRMSAGMASVSVDGTTTQRQLSLIRESVQSAIKARNDCFNQILRPALESAGIEILEWSKLTEGERHEANRYYRQNVFQILTPQAVDPGHPFPFISNLSLSIGVSLRQPDRDEQLFARVKVPTVLPQLMRLTSGGDSGKHRFVHLASIIEHNLETLFPGMNVGSVMLFRVTRNAEMDIDDYETEDIVEMVEEELRERRFARVLRLEHETSSDKEMLQFLTDEIELKEEDVYETPGHLDYLALREIADLNIPALKYDIWSAPPPLPWVDEEANVFSIIKSNDVLVSHPFESFTGSVERFLRAAVDDPKVLAIKMTLYRAGDKSAIVPLLIRAAESEKQVVVLIEVKAQFDEARNIRLAQTLEEAGIHVMYGVVGLKTHAKVILVARQEPEGIRCYAHIGTGNYNPQSARVYTDLGLFTARQDITDDVVELFHYLTGRSMKREYRQLFVAPHNMRENFLRLVEREISHAQAKAPAHIIVKVNSFEDPMMCRALVKAAQNGVRVDVIVRGICCIRPPAGLSNLKIISVIGRFLEHSRVMYFRNAAAEPVDGDFFITSADWMYRNLSRRVEVAVPLMGRSERERVLELLKIMIEDTRQAWDLDSEGKYHQRKPVENTESALGTHGQLMKLTRDRLRVLQSGGVSVPLPPSILHDSVSTGQPIEEGMIPAGPINDDQV